MDNKIDNKIQNKIQTVQGSFTAFSLMPGRADFKTQALQAYIQLVAEFEAIKKEEPELQSTLENALSEMEKTFSPAMKQAVIERNLHITKDLKSLKKLVTNQKLETLSIGVIDNEAIKAFSGRVSNELVENKIGNKALPQNYFIGAGDKLKPANGEVNVKHGKKKPGTNEVEEVQQHYQPIKPTLPLNRAIGILTEVLQEEQALLAERMAKGHMSIPDGQKKNHSWFQKMKDKVSSSLTHASASALNHENKIR